MKIVLILLIALPACAAPKWARALASVTTCAMQAADLGTTAIGIRRGALESGPLNTRGKPQWRNMIALKSGLCATSIALVKTSRVPTAVVFAFTGPVTAVTSMAVSHNIGELTAPKTIAK